MMKKTVLSLGLAVFLLAMFVSPVLALEIEVDQAGNINLYQGYVLGETTDRPSIRPIMAPNPDSGDEVRTVPNRTIPRRADRDLVVTMEDEGTRVEMRAESGQANAGSEVMMSDNLEVRFPAKYRQLTEEQRSKMNEYQEKIMTQRQERIKEMAELRERNMGDEKTLELKSREVKAKVNGAEFVLDPENNEVKLTTPSGQVHILTHLPDQAINRMEEAGVIREFTDDDTLEAVADDTGIKYVAKVKEPKKLLSFFPRMVERQITLDDATGEVSQDYTAKGWFNRMLDRLSY